MSVGLLLWLAGCTDGTGPSTGPCAAGSPVVPPLGEVMEPDALVGGGVCLESAEGADVVVVVATTSPSAIDSPVDVDILGTGFVEGAEDVLASVSPALRSGSRGSSLATRPRVFGPPEIVHLPLAQRPTPDPTRRSSPWPPSSGAAARAVPTVGTFEEYPTAVSCGDPPNVRRGRVVSVGAHSVVLVDEDVPSGGFNDVQLQAFGDFFDEDVYPTITDAFGSPSDIDDNQRVVIFFTPASNALSPQGSNSVVGGFFWGGDLFPATERPGSQLEPCASSAEGEILYMSVPDPDGSVAAPIRADQLQTEAVLAHEFQHLLNAAIRIHVAGSNTLEETWLNEGLSYIAEEELFFATAEVEAGGNLDGERMTELGVLDQFNRFQYGNVGRYNVFLLGPHFHSVMGSDRIETRGAAWSLLRYVLDRSTDPAAVLRALQGSETSGLANLEAALGTDPTAWMAEWAVSLVADDLAGLGGDPRFQQASWNLKAILPDLRADGRYPLALVGVPPDQGIRFQLRTGGAGFGSLELQPATPASVLVRPESGTKVRAFIVRVR